MSRSLIALFCLFSSLTLIAFAQSEPTEPRSDIPPSLKQNCILTPDGLIDTCPAYRQTMRTQNRTLAQQRTTLLSSGMQNLTTLLDAQIANQKRDKLNLLKSHPTSSTIVMTDYEQYITRRFRDYIRQNSDTRQLVKSFFATTYFDTDQSGLGLSKIALYKTVPNQYDDTIVAQINVRNFTLEAMDQIEDIYCFTSIGDQDYIFPLGIQSIFAKNSITTLVAPISIKSSPLLDTFGEKSLYCTMVYTQDGTEKYTNRGTLSFTLKP